MRTFTSAEAALSAEYGIEVGRWAQYDGVEGFPFQAMWCVVAPGSQSALDHHPEVELAVVVGGQARFVVGDRVVGVATGTAVLLEPYERHVIHNDSDAEPLRILSVYWLPEAPVAGASAAEMDPVAALGTAAGTTVVLSPPPTPNGPLHLGHLSGPYVAADIAVRAGRRRGEPTISVCGLDDSQNHVLAAARAAHREAGELRNDNAGLIRDVFARMGIEHDIFTEPATDPVYRADVARLFDELVTTGVLPVEEWTAPGCEPCGGTLHHAYVSGRCFCCGEPAAGGTCEGCGSFLTAATLVDPRCARCGAPPSNTVRVSGPVLRLEDFRDHLTAVWCRASIPPRVRTIIGRLLGRPLPTIPLSYPTDWGIPVASPQGHRLDVWAEMALGYLRSVGRHLDPTAETVADHVAAWREVSALWAFLGIDNAFYYAVMFPAMFGAFGLPADMVAGLVVNEFYTLDGAKFSTSRGHAVWAHELLAEQSPEVVRAFLCWDRPQPYPSDFTFAHFLEVTGLWSNPPAPARGAAIDVARAERALTYRHFAPALAARCLLPSGEPDGPASEPAGPAYELLTVLTGSGPTVAGERALVAVGEPGSRTQPHR